ncbi:MAG: HEAT repeat domain-containing protein [Burkholderiales bacterium]|nr:HEAT repeat domain-containing protein [Burkholderiales bacterium]
MKRGRLSYGAGLLLVALFATPAWPDAPAGDTLVGGLQLGYAPSSPEAAPGVQTDALHAGGMQLKLAREMRDVSPTAAASEVPLLSSVPYGILIAILLFLAVNIVLLLLLSMVMRVRRERRQQRRERFVARWEPVLHARISGDAAALPHLAAAERLLFLGTWLHMLGYVRGDAAASLVQVARELGLSQYALRLLESGSPWKRIIAMRAVAALGLEQACDTLMAKAMQNRPRSSLTAVRALLQIDPERGFAALGYLLEHQKWSPAAMVEIVRVGGSQAVQKLAALVHTVPPGHAKQMVRLIELLEGQAALPALRERLVSSGDEEEIAAILHCLGRLGQGEDRSIALGFLDHASWLVRMQAAFMLGAFGLGQDVARLVLLLRDRQWWVRYRAAQSLLRLAGVATLAAMREREPDPYSREMLERVLAEGR